MNKLGVVLLCSGRCSGSLACLWHVEHAGNGQADASALEVRGVKLILHKRTRGVFILRLHSLIWRGWDTEHFLFGSSQVGRSREQLVRH